jgi:hypothetical protein
VTLIVRVEWFAGSVNKSGGGDGVSPRFVELRTVLADPFRGGAG